MMIFHKSIPRRSFLRGAGAAIALPLLDSMSPAMAAVNDPAAKPAVRLAYIYVPNGIMMDRWTPSAEGANIALTPALESWSAVKDRLVLLSGLDGGPVILGGGHERATSMWLTGTNPRQSVYDIQCGVSVDQAAARELGKSTQLDSLELAIENAAELVGNGAGYAAVYTNTVSWRTPKTPNPTEHKPRAVFERLFGDGGSTDSAERRARLKRERSILDFVSQEANRLLADVGASDRGKLGEYFDAIRDVEVRVQKADAAPDTELPEMQRPVGIPTYEDHVRLMLDMMLLAFQTDLTRVITFMMAREQSQLIYSQLGINEPHHPLTHNRGLKERMDQTAKINAYHTKLFGEFLQKMRATNDGDGSLLDHAMIVYGSGLGDGDIHEQYNLPVALIGGGAGKIKPGLRHIRFAKETPFCNLHLAMLNMAGVPATSFGNSTGEADVNQFA